MTDEKKKILIANMTDNLKTLRVRLGMSQSDLAKVIGVNRHTVMNIETRRSDMTWPIFLALILLFIKNKETNKLLNVLEIYTEDLNEFIQQGENK